MKLAIFKNGEVPKQIDYDGVMVEVCSTTPAYSWKDNNYTQIRTIFCPVCNKKIWLNGLVCHLAHQTRSSDSGHAKMYIILMTRKGQRQKAMDNIKKWTDRHRHGLTMLERVIEVA